MIPIAPGFFKPVQASAPTSWEYSGAILSLCVWQKGPVEGSSFYDNNVAPYWDNNDPDNFVYEIRNDNPVDLDYRDPSYDQEVPFTFNENTKIRSEAWEGDISADYASHWWQLLDDDNNNIYLFECVGRASNFGVDCYHTIGSGSRNSIAATGLYPALNHLFTFSGTTITATDEYGGANHVNSYTATGVSLSSATKLKVGGGRAYMSHSGVNSFDVYTRVSYWPDGY